MPSEVKSELQPFSDSFLPHLEEAERLALSQVPDLEQQLAGLWSVAREAWPEVDVPAEEFFRFLARRLDLASLGPLNRLRAEDLYLLCGYVKGLPGCAALFEARYFVPVTRALRRIRADPDMIEDVKQTLRHRLLLDRVVDPRHKHYMGTGDLASWLCICAVHEVGHRRDKRDRDVAFEQHTLSNLPAQDDDQELAYLKQLYRREFKEAFQEALDALPPRERNILRYNVLKGLNIEEIGAIYRVHRATVARWIAHARELLLHKTRENLSRRVRMSNDQLESMLRLIESQMDVSLRRCLDATP